MHIDPGPNNQNAGNGGSLLAIILAVVISVIIVWFVVSISRRHAVALDEGGPPAATGPAQQTAPTQPAPTP